MATFNPGMGVRPVEYLFVDGAYLRRHLDEWSRDFFSGACIELDFAQFAHGFQKTFYYDCLPPRIDGELQEAYDERVRPQREFFNTLKELNGFHVYEGTTSGTGAKARQKQVDIMIAVHMLSHTIRANMSKATLVAGDLDFKPLIDALIQEGMYVTLWCNRRSTSRELEYAADARRDLNLLEIWSRCKKGFVELHPIPNRCISSGMQKDAGFDVVREGVSKTGEHVVLWRHRGGQHTIGYRGGNSEDEYVCWQHKDGEFLERFVAEIGIAITWDQ
jgi:uncharacterized LabA/DUF88 family protein